MFAVNLRWLSWKLYSLPLLNHIRINSLYLMITTFRVTVLTITSQRFSFCLFFRLCTATWKFPSGRDFICVIFRSPIFRLSQTFEWQKETCKVSTYVLIFLVSHFFPPKDCRPGKSLTFYVVTFQFQVPTRHAFFLSPKYNHQWQQSDMKFLEIDTGVSDTSLPTLSVKFCT